jgi:hypothetical protein
VARHRAGSPWGNTAEGERLRPPSPLEPLPTGTTSHLVDESPCEVPLLPRDCGLDRRDARPGPPASTYVGTITSLDPRSS